MPDRETHLVQAQRFEAFLKQVDRSDQTYREWIVIVWFHIVLHYVDAVLAEKKRWHQIESHADRTAKMHNCEETRAIYETSTSSTWKQNRPAIKERPSLRPISPPSSPITKRSEAQCGRP